MKKAVSLFLLSIYVVFAISTFWKHGGNENTLYSGNNSLNENQLAEKEFTETAHFAVGKASRLNRLAKKPSHFKPSPIPAVCEPAVITSSPFNKVPCWLKNRELLI